MCMIAMSKLLLIAIGSLLGLHFALPSPSTVNVLEYSYVCDGNELSGNGTCNCTANLSQSCAANFVNITQYNYSISCSAEDRDPLGNEKQNPMHEAVLYKKLLAIVGGVLVATNFLTFTLCSVALCLSRRKIASLKHTTKSLHQKAEYEERVVYNPAYRDLDLKATKSHASTGKDTEHPAQYSYLGPAYESVRGVNHRMMTRGADCDGNAKGGNSKRPVRRTEPANCLRTYHKVHTDVSHDQWYSKVLPSDNHSSYSRLYH